jgi:two-component system LytT family response regulator
MIRTLIVDDEEPARSRLRTLLQRQPDIDIIGECADGEQALERILEGGVDLVLLDVDMPRLNGLAVVELTPKELMPLVIFVTAYDQYAMRAFDAHAIDYLLKPYDRDRFEAALERARRWMAGDERAAQRRRLADAVATAGGSAGSGPTRVAVRSRGRISIVKIESLDWIEAEGNYVRFHVGAQSLLHRQSLQQILETFDPARFIRVHRSAIVAIDRIREIRLDANGDARAVLADGATVPVGRAYREALERTLSS